MTAGSAFRHAILALAMATASGIAGAALAQGSKEPPPGGPEAGGPLRGHGGPVKALALDWHVRKDGSEPDAILLSGSFDYSMAAWAAGPSSAKLHKRFDEFEGAVNAVGLGNLSGRDAYYAAGDDGKLWLFDFQSGQKLAALQGHSAKINHVGFSFDAVVTSSWDGTARVWRLKYDRATASAIPRAEPVILNGHAGPVMAAAFHDRDRYVFTASSDGNLRKFDAQTGQLMRVAYKHGWGLNALLRLSDSQLLIGATDGTVAIFDITKGAITKRLAKHDGPVLALAGSGLLSTDKSVATGGGDGVIRVWNVKTWELVEEFRNPLGPVWAMAFSPGGRSIYWGGLDDAIHVWQINPRKAFEPAQGQYPRRFQVKTDSDDPVERGRIQFARKCSVCHTLTPEGRNRAGPTLHGIFGRRIATLKGYTYSEPLKDLDIVWTPETVAKLFELGPDKFTPGSKMPLQKMTDQQQRDDLIAFLEQATGPQASSPRARGSIPIE